MKKKQDQTPSTTTETAGPASPPKGRAVVVTTEDRGVFFGYVVDESKAPQQITLGDLRNCIYWPVSARGFIGLASSGPPSGSRVGPPAGRGTLYKLTSVLDASPAAVEAWEKAPWA